MIQNCFRVLFVLWAGSLWSLAAWVAPTLFHAQGDRHLAGMLAGKLFSIETYAALGVAVLALVLPGRGKFVWGYLAAALLSVNEWVLKRVMAQALHQGAVAGLTFGVWHGVSAVLYLLACAAVLRLVWNDDFR
jgi:hypothetical protein